MQMLATRAEDLDLVLRAEQDPSTRAMILPWSRDAHRASLADPDIRHRIAWDGQEAVGFAILAGIESPHHGIELRRIVATPPGRGAGRHMLRELCRLCFDELAAHRVWLDTQTGNCPARALYTSEGFVEEGVLRECWLQDGSYRSLVIMSLLEAEYRARCATGSGSAPDGSR